MMDPAVVVLMRRIEKTCNGQNVSDVCDALVSALFNVITHALIDMDNAKDPESRAILVRETRRALAAIEEVLADDDPEGAANRLAIILHDHDGKPH